MAEQRRSPRREFDRRAWCEHPNLTLYLPISNLSEGGMFLSTTTPFALGDLLTVSFDGDAPEPEGPPQVVADVQIVWTCKRDRAASGVGAKILQVRRGADEFARILDELPAE